MPRWGIQGSVRYFKQIDNDHKGWWYVFSSLKDAALKYEAVFCLYVIAIEGVQEHYKINFISTDL